MREKRREEDSGPTLVSKLHYVDYYLDVPRFKHGTLKYGNFAC
jgi:hypothetical protein